MGAALGAAYQDRRRRSLVSHLEARMRYATVCSGIEACSAAWHPIGWQPQFFSEIEPFPSAVLAHHYPTVPNLGDMTKFKDWPDYELDLICGGTPCQSFSVAGLRKGLDDPRGNLMLTFGAIADRYRPKWLVWENVPGVLSSNGGRDFATFLGMLAKLGYGFAYRVLDAQFFGVAQRRRRVFVVGCLGDWRRASAVLFERHSLSGHPAPSRKAGQGVAATTAPSLTASGRGVERTGESRGQDPVIATFDRQSSGEYGTAPVASTVSARDYKGVSDIVTQQSGNVAGAICKDSFSGGAGGRPEGAAAGHFLPVPKIFQDSESPQAQAVCAAFKGGQGAGAGGIGYDEHVAPTLSARDGGNRTPTLLNAMQVRRLTTVECARLQGFSDDYLSQVTWRGKSPPPDGPMYKALGNSMAVPVMSWIGKRIQTVSEI